MRSYQLSFWHFVAKDSSSLRFKCQGKPVKRVCTFFPKKNPQGREGGREGEGEGEGEGGIERNMDRIKEDLVCQIHYGHNCDKQTNKH